MRVIAFTPALGGGTTQTISATSTSSRVVLTPTPVPNVRIYNAGSSTIYWAAGPTTVTATTSTGTPLASGMTEVFGISRQASIAAICSTSGSATVFVTPGEGI